jgi:hypothetical protein
MLTTMTITSLFSRWSPGHIVIPSNSEVRAVLVHTRIWLTKSFALTETPRADEPITSAVILRNSENAMMQTSGSAAGTIFDFLF